MTTLEQKMYDGARAKDVLENESFLWAFESTEQELIELWKSSPARDAEGREKLFLMLQMLNKVKQTLTSRMETGKLAKLELEHKRNLAARIKEVWQ